FLVFEFAEDVVAERPARTDARKRKNAAAWPICRRLDTGQIEPRGREIDARDQRIRDAAPALVGFGCAEHERHARRFVFGDDLAEAAVAAHHPAVVAEKKDDGVVLQSALVERFEYAANLLVEV